MQSLLSLLPPSWVVSTHRKYSKSTSFSTPTKLIMKLKHISGMKIPAEVKQLESFFIKPRLQELKDKSLMDWSKDVPEVQSSPTPCVSPVGDNVSSSCTLLHNRDAKGKERTESIDSGSSLLNYSRILSSIPSSWNGAHYILSIFGTNKTSEKDAINMA